VVAIITVDDPTHPTRGETCTGTVLAVKGTTGYVLTAAHCFTEANPSWTTFVFTTDSYAIDTVATAHKVTDHLVHPSYNATSHQYDFAMLKFDGATGLPTTAALTSAADDVGVGSFVTLVGYGFTSGAFVPDGDGGPNTARRSFRAPVSGIDPLQIVIDETTAKGGQCQGDSGGPLLYDNAGTVFVAGVISAGASSCTGIGLSNRVSAVQADFIQSYLDDKPVAITPTCATCQATASKPGAVCAKSLEACGASDECGAFTLCAANCKDDDACVDGCRHAHAKGAHLYEAFTGCMCTLGCPMECAVEMKCPGADGGLDASVTSDAAASTPTDAGSSGGSGGGSGGCHVGRRSREGSGPVLLIAALGVALRRRKARAVGDANEAPAQAPRLGST
jgi:hypothetical protein